VYTHPNKRRGQRSALFQKSVLEQQILQLLGEFDRHLPEKQRANDHYVAAARKTAAQYCGSEEVGSGEVYLLLQLRLLRDGQTIAARSAWPDGALRQAQAFFEKYELKTLH